MRIVRMPEPATVLQQHVRFSGLQIELHKTASRADLELLGEVVPAGLRRDDIVLVDLHKGSPAVIGLARAIKG